MIFASYFARHIARDAHMLEYSTTVTQPRGISIDRNGFCLMAKGYLYCVAQWQRIPVTHEKNCCEPHCVDG